MKKIYLNLLFCLLPVLAFSQNNLRPGAYYQDMLFYNPASLPLMGEQGNRLLVNSRSKLVNENQPVWENNFALFANYLKFNEEDNTFFQIGYVYDPYSFFSRNTLNFGYGKRFELGDHSSITFGGNVNLHSDFINWSNLQLPNNESGRSMRLSPDLGLGTQFQWKKLRLGASLNNMIGISQNLEDEELIKTQSVVVINASYDFKIRENITLAPYLLFYQELRSEIDIGLFMSFNDKFNASYLFRVFELRSIFTLESKVLEGLSIGAAYDTSPLFPDNNLDIFVRYFY